MNLIEVLTKGDWSKEECVEWDLTDWVGAAGDNQGESEQRACLNGGVARYVCLGVYKEGQEEKREKHNEKYMNCDRTTCLRLHVERIENNSGKYNKWLYGKCQRFGKKKAVF